MIFPYKDINPSNTFPYVTAAIIALNVLIFVGQFAMDGSVAQSVNTYGFRPVSLISMSTEGESPATPIITLFLSMFMHGGLMHLVGNMLFLWICGDNIEDVMGHGFYAFFYVIGGLIASLTHTVFAMDSPVPMIGASGAVAAVLGAYLVLFPKARIKTLVIIFLFFTVVLIPAWLLIGFWILTNLFMGVLSLASPMAGGVAWFAHLGGLAFGVLLALPFKGRLRHATRVHATFRQWPNEWRL
ncbi:rhomboid family intramembrane serine protease [bacterium]|nr:rhomboid family intramembrane serine protease [bacterium]